MSAFSILVEPEFGAEPSYDFDPLPKDIDWRRVADVHANVHNILYQVGSELFGYYPADLAIAFGDLLEEWRAVVSRRSHFMSLSGYTVLHMELVGEEVKFSDPNRATAKDQGTLISGQYAARDIEAAFYHATANAWGAVLQALAKSSTGD